MGKGGRSDVGDGQDKDLRQNKFFAEFLQEDFSAADYASKALTEATATAQGKIELLELGIRQLDEKLNTEVASRQEELLGQAYSLRDAEGAVQGISMASETLLSALKRVQDEVLEPYERITVQTIQLKNLQASTGLLRHTVQSLKLISRLRTHIKAGPTGSDTSGIMQLGILDVGKAAKLLSDITATGEEEADLRNMQVIAEESLFLSVTRSQVRMQAQASLDKGMETLNQAEVGSALQIFFNLQELLGVSKQLVDGHVSRLQRLFTDALDSKKLVSEGSSGPAGLLPGGARSVAASARVQEGLWQRLAAYLDQLLKSSVAVWHLQRVMAKKRDPLTHILFLDSILEAGGPLPLSHFWTESSKAMRMSLEDATNTGRGGVVKEALIHGYPRLSGLLDDFFKRLHQETHIKGVQPAASQEEEESLVGATLCCQNLYLGSVLGRVTDAVNTAFTGGNRALPTAAELHRYIGRMHEELKAAGDGPRLASLTSQMVSKSLQMLAEKAEYMSAGGQELRSIGGACTSAQLRNITLCNQLQEVSRSFASFLPRLPTSAASYLGTALEVLEAGAVEAVLPLMRAVVDRGEALLLKMHELDFDSEGTPDVTRASGYILDLERHLSHSRVEYLSKFSPAASFQNAASVGAALTQRFASRMIVFFVRQASLLRPLSKAGKLQLAKDISELEEAVGSNLWPVDQLKSPHKTLRAFRRIIFLETEALKDSNALRDLPPLVILHHLYSRAPASLQSPHVDSGFTPRQYSLWLDQHTASEALRRIRTTLDASSQTADKCKEVYDLMLQLCE